MILPLEKQVCSLQLAKKMKALGVKQESSFYWSSKNGNGDYKVSTEKLAFSDLPYYSAFTVAELYQIHYEKFGTMDKIPVEISGEDLANYIANLIINNYEASN